MLFLIEWVGKSLFLTIISGLLGLKAHPVDYLSIWLRNKLEYPASLLEFFIVRNFQCGQHKLAETVFGCFFSDEVDRRLCELGQSGLYTEIKKSLRFGWAILIRLY